MQYNHLLTGRFIQLERFTSHHIPELESIALDAAIWTNLPYRITDTASFQLFMNQVKDKNLKGEQITYVIRNNQTNSLCGSTGFIHVDTVNSNLEIGPTWLTPGVWGTTVNIESKYLLLHQCFEQHNIMRVEFRTRETNIRSQKAIEKMGAIKEGLLRNHRVNDDGSFRNTIVYSIIRPEWPLIKAKLELILNA